MLKNRVGWHENLLFKIDMYVDTRENIYSRKVFNILDFLSNIGGIIEVLTSVVSIFIKPISYHNFLLHAISNLFILKSTYFNF